MNIATKFKFYYPLRFLRHLLIISICFLLIQLNAFSQNKPENLEKLATSYFSAGEFEKARDTYEELIKLNRYSLQYSDRYLECLLRLDDLKNAEKFTLKQSKAFPDNPKLQIDYAWILEKNGDNKKAQKIFDEIMNNKQLHFSGRVPLAANAFMYRGYSDFAIKTYLNARQVAQNPLSYTMEIAELYAIKGDFGPVFGEYLNYLEMDVSFLDQVKQRLQLYLTDDNHYEPLKNELILRLQKIPENFAYQELLFWVFVQQKEWDGAFVQMRSLDQRTDKSGRRLMELAQICLDNEAYGVAIKCYENIKSRGEDFPLYNTAESGLLNARLLKIEKGAGAELSELRQLEKDFESFLERRGHLSGSENARLNLAGLQIHYLDEVAKGIEALKSFVELPRISKPMRGDAKLRLADAYLINGEDWEAHLLYKQVEKEFKDEPIGQEARFKYAKLCYFRGEFEWALTQLEVLKGATTQLISNNAIELALHIIESTGLDTTEETLQSFAQAEWLIYRNKTAEANQLLKELQDKIKYHELSDNILFLKAKIAEKNGDIPKAITLYEDLVQKYYYGLLVDDALIQLGRLYEYRLKDLDKAKAAYEKLLTENSGSFYAFEARNRYRRLRGEKLP